MRATHLTALYSTVFESGVVAFDYTETDVNAENMTSFHSATVHKSDTAN